jgi:hypothetical protein
MRGRPSSREGRQVQGHKTCIKIRAPSKRTGGRIGAAWGNDGWPLFAKTGSAVSLQSFGAISVRALGSVVAYEAICAVPTSIHIFLTLGSPLGLTAAFDKLRPSPGAWPTNVKRWVNIAANGDIVAAQKKLAPLFRGTAHDHTIDSGWDAHSSTRYLNTKEAGQAIVSALAA